MSSANSVWRNLPWRSTWFSGLSVLLTVAIIFPPPFALADAVRVRYVEGLSHGFLVVRTTEGKRIATGDTVQVVHGERVTSRMILHFDDGSLYEDTTVFSERGKFQLERDHLIQKGPSFKQPMDVLTNAATGDVTVHYKDKDGKDKMEFQHLNLPPDLANGLIFTLLKNIDPSGPQTTLSMVVASPKPRLVKLIINSEGESPFTVGNSERKATSFDVKIKVEGAAGWSRP